ncbi:uncharacterized protein LOC116594374 [Mustela erminea]|uniref:uncharacterized protein LOC116594374 n=1 Tax=Mustela erminea TaxID=36723 RepID=UPI001386772B|nr:uncharacterized protein LOC116594374 [Mustela erminea]XP_032205611.1 uncharacterized protein LOC116594374 [Mustela erminea]
MLSVELWRTGIMMPVSQSLAGGAKSSGPHSSVCPERKAVNLSYLSGLQPVSRAFLSLAQGSVWSLQTQQIPAILFLPEEEALEGHTTVWGVISGIAVHQSQLAYHQTISEEQERPLQSIYLTHVDPLRVQYKTHSMGMSAGDPTKVETLENTIGRNKQQGTPVLKGFLLLDRGSDVESLDKLMKTKNIPEAHQDAFKTGFAEGFLKAQALMQKTNDSLR